MNLFGDLVFKLSPSLYRKRISIRHLGVIFVFSLSLYTLYYNYHHRFEADIFGLPREEFIEHPAETPEIWAARAQLVKEAFLHAYHGYERYAFPRDELLPVSNESIDNFNGWGVTAVDSLDTMLLMDLKEEYNRALPMVRQTNFSLPDNTRVPFFETTIRYLGGLLAAYAITKDDTLRDRADALGTLLSPVFDTPSGFPLFGADTFGSDGGSGPSIAVLAEIASFQLEYAYLGKITGKKEHVNRATKVSNIFSKADLRQTGGMYPTRWDLYSGTPANLHLSAGALADSGHEYTLKQYLLTAKKDLANLEMYIDFTTHILLNNLFLSPTRQLLYVTDIAQFKASTRVSHAFEHLSCFLPGLLALGAHTLPLNNISALNALHPALKVHEDTGALLKLLPQLGPSHDGTPFTLASLHLAAAQGLAESCYVAYADQPTGLGPETIQMSRESAPWMDTVRAWGKKSGGDSRGPLPGTGDKPHWIEPVKAHAHDDVDEYEDDYEDEGGDEFWGAPDASGRVLAPKKGAKPPRGKKRDYVVRNADYYLRPETVESLYILYRVTGDVRWRQHGWAIFQAIERITKMPAGYATVKGVNTHKPRLSDSMPSYFLAETLKYLYLLFKDEDLVPLDQWVFNTEAHPFPVFEWTAAEKAAYGVS
ncbi:glycoside hydrolase family 47 protein [Hygrophoropsis aurantiaca]|uniref:Glycoside hydrolase family 47 protein n=1 Tax=Hygrophoropsis aurantiaca TaxID=72124 RepID=A0ACB8A5F4_9AGAM|nr:glycoside hydrolase family 47 protein [Hygrophoropsis aurantiaca]